jgi:hypothetical protein
MLKRYREDELLRKPLSDKQKEELRPLEAATDEDIDTQISLKPVNSLPAPSAESTLNPGPVKR